MKVLFVCSIEEKLRHYYGDPKLQEEEEYTRTFEIEWLDGCQLPKKGDLIQFDHLIGDIEEPWAEVFYGRYWDVDYIVWEWDKDVKVYLPKIEMTNGEK